MNTFYIHLNIILFPRNLFCVIDLH